jgi:sirohydrochlorin cobaltochelatase
MQRPGILLVGHGTRDPLGTSQFFELGEQLQLQAGEIPVQPCLLELQQPDISTGIANLVQQGVDYVRVVPLLLFSAGHAKSDIPAAVRAAANCYHHLSFDFARPLSRHPAILKLARERISEAMSAHSPCKERTGVLVVGRGSHDPCARSDMLLLSELLRHQIGMKLWQTCFYAMAKPSLEEGLDAISQDAAIQNIVVYPHLLFAGHLYQAIVQRTREYQSELKVRTGRKVEFLTTGYLGPTPDVALAIWSRLHQTGQSLFLSPEIAQIR